MTVVECGVMSEHQLEQEQFQQHIRAEETRNSKLFFALRSRVLTDEEMADVADLDYRILVKMGQPFRKDEVMRMFSEALLQQFKIRAVAHRSATNPPPELPPQSETDDSKING